MIDRYSPNEKVEPRVEVKIILKDDTPLYERRTTPAEKEDIERLRKGIIQESRSEFTSLVVLGSKNVLRFQEVKCSNGQRSFPSPINWWHHWETATCSDFYHTGFGKRFLLRVCRARLKEIHFIHYSQFENLTFRKVPFGLSNSPAAFTRYIIDALKPLLVTLALRYININIK